MGRGNLATINAIVLEPRIYYGANEHRTNASSTAALKHFKAASRSLDVPRSKSTILAAGDEMRIPHDRSGDGAQFDVCTKIDVELDGSQLTDASTTAPQSPRELVPWPWPRLERPSPQEEFEALRHMESLLDCLLTPTCAATDDATKELEEDAMTDYHRSPLMAQFLGEQQVLAMRSALLSEPYVASIEVGYVPATKRGSSTVSIVVALRPSDGSDVLASKMVLTSAQRALLAACEQSERVYVLGYACAPFQENSEGTAFSCVLGLAPEDQKLICWDTFTHGFCPRREKKRHCRWQHPERSSLNAFHLSIVEGA